MKIFFWVPSKITQHHPKMPEYAERQIGRGQDCARAGIVDDVHYAFVADGHGSSKCIDALREINLNELALSENPCDYVQARMVALGSTYKSGFTFAFARVRNNTVQVWTVGDAEARIFFNGVLVHETTPHTFLNEVELARTASLVDFVEMTKAPFPVSPTRVELVPSPIGHFKNGENLVPSMAFGHDNVTGLEPAFYEATCDGVIRVVCGSDGFFDMLIDGLDTKTADQLASEAAERWNQTWEFFDGKTTVRTTYGGGFDDVAVAIC